MGGWFLKEQQAMAKDTEGGSGELPYTMPIPDCGELFFGLSKNGSYAAADRGEIPTVRIGRLRKALPRVLARTLEGRE
jgi:hypothetical protein